MHMPPFIHKHPYIIGGVCFAVVAWYLYNRTQVNAAAASAPVVTTSAVSSTTDPNADALAAQQESDNASLAAANISAQLQTAQINANVQMNSDNNATSLAMQNSINQNNLDLANSNNNAAITTAYYNDTAQVQLGQINANTVNAQTLASVYSTAVGGILNSDYTTATDNSTVPAGSLLYSNGQYTNLNGQSSAGGQIASTVNLSAAQAAALGYVAHTNQWSDTVPVYQQSTTNNPATNTAANQIEEMFNNIARAGMGTAPLQTVTMQPSQSTQLTQTGTAHIDPVFAVWDGSSATPTITDVTLNPDSVFGYTGSVFNPTTMSAAQVITPNATTTGLPN